MPYNILTFKDLNHSLNSCTCQRISAVGCAVISRLQRIFCNFFRHCKCTDRDSVSDCLCHSQNIRFHTKSLPCKHISGSSHSTLHFITDHQDSIFITDLTDSFHKFLCRKVDSTFALKWLQNNCTSLIIYQCFHAVKIIKLRKSYTRNDRLERFTIRIMSCHGNCSKTSSMERILHCNEFISSCFLCVSISSGSFQSTFVCLSATVRKEDSVHSGNAVQLFRRLATTLMEIKI